MYICIMYVYFTEQRREKRREKKKEKGKDIYVLYIRVCVSKRERGVIYR